MRSFVHKTSFHNVYKENNRPDYIRIMEPVIIIPAYNEEKVIANVLKELQKHNYHSIIVVDDGSKDNTAKIAESLNVKVIRHPINRGQGAALKTGIEYDLEQGND